MWSVSRAARTPAARYRLQRRHSLYILFRISEEQCGYPAAAALKPEIGRGTRTNYEQFRRLQPDNFCYLSSITSGGAFHRPWSRWKSTKLREGRLHPLSDLLAPRHNRTTKKNLAGSQTDIARDDATRNQVLSNLFTYSNKLSVVAEVFVLYDSLPHRCNGLNAAARGLAAMRLSRHFFQL